MKAGQTEGPVAAVEYVRMSTEQQHFSIDAQKELISAYAREHGYEVLRTYADPGQSGLSLRGRTALQTLLSDALRPDRDFAAILVRDVSRWGRFQDPDQAAHYEFICRQAGVQIVYCAEPFVTDTTPVSTIVKHLKRVMASEYSRDLSDRVSRAQLHQARLGYRQGGIPIYGFRRQLTDEHGVGKRILKPGETKTLVGERVRIVLGPEDELAVIRAVFDLYVRQEWSLVEIALFLCNQGVPGNLGKPWTSRMVRNVLTCELCIGCYTFNRTTRKLQTAPRKNSNDRWVRAPDACTPIVTKELFDSAQLRLLKRRPTKLSRAGMLEHLRALIAEKGRVSLNIVNQAPFVPNATTYARHFGNMAQALSEIDYVPPLCVGRPDRGWSTDDLRTKLRRLYEQHGFLSKKLITGDHSLPCYSSIQRKLGPLEKVYDFIGVDHNGRADIVRQALDRRSQKLRGRAGPKGWKRGWDKQYLLTQLRHLLLQHGYLSASLIDACPDLPTISTIASHFGSVMAAYEAAGWTVSRSELAVLRCARAR